METTFSALLALCAGNSPVTGEFPTQRPVTRSFGVFFDLHLNKRLSKQWWGWWFETPSHSLWRHRNDVTATSHHFTWWMAPNRALEGSRQGDRLRPCGNKSQYSVLFQFPSGVSGDEWNWLLGFYSVYDNDIYTYFISDYICRGISLFL